MASFALEDLEEKIEVLVFPRAMVEHGPKLTDDAVVMVRGRLDTREDTLRFFANEIDVGGEQRAGSAVAGQPPARAPERPAAAQAAAKSVLCAHPGGSPVELLLGARRVARLPEDYAVDTANGLPAELRELLGAEAIAAV